MKLLDFFCLHHFGSGVEPNNQSLNFQFLKIIVTYLVIQTFQHDKFHCVLIIYELQIISNGELKGAEHRAVTNSSVPRTSAAFFIYPSKDDLIEPAKALTNADNPPLYGSMQFKEFQRNYLSYAANAEKVQKFISSTQL